MYVVGWEWNVTSTRAFGISQVWIDTSQIVMTGGGPQSPTFLIYDSLVPHMNERKRRAKLSHLRHG